MRWLVLTALLLVPIGPAQAQQETNWAEVDVSGYTRISSPIEILPSISTVYFFDNKGFGLQYSGLSSSTQEVGALASWRVWTGLRSDDGNRALNVHVLGRWMNEVGEELDFSKGDVGVELRPDLDVKNKATTCMRILWSMEEGAKPRFTVGFGVQFDVT